MGNQYRDLDLSITEYRKIFFRSLGKYFQLIITELGRLDEKRSLNKVYSVQDDVPFNLPNGWIWSTIGQVIEFTSTCNIQAQFDADTLINYVDIDAIDNKEYRVREVKERRVAELSSRARRVLKKGYMVYSLVRPYLNNIAIIEVDKKNFIGSTGFAVFKGTSLKNEFLKFILLSDYVRESYLDMLSGFNSPSITQDQFINTKVPVPPLSEQEGIIDFLSDLENNTVKSNYTYFNKAVEEKIVNLHNSQLLGNKLLIEISSQQEKLSLLRQAILQEAVQGKLTPQVETDEPASELLKRIKAEKQKLVKEGKLKKEKELPPITEEEIPFELPKGWVWCRFGNIVEIKGGKRLPNGHQLVKENTGKIYIRVTDMKNGTIDDSDLHYLKPETFKHIQNYTIEKDDLYLVIVGSTIGKSGIVPEKFHKMNLTENAVKLKPILVIKEFVNYALKSKILMEQFYDKTKQVGQPKLAIVRIQNSLFPVPPISEQFRIVSKVEKFMQYINQLEQEVSVSQTRAQQLLQVVLKETFDGKREEYSSSEELTLAAEA